MKYFAWIYEYKPNNPRLGDIRPAHREFIGSLHEQGHIAASGPFTDTKGGALIILQFKDESTTLQQVLELADKDPYFTEGIVTARQIREWGPVIDTFATD